MQRIFATFHKNLQFLQIAFRVMDADNSGYVTLEEFTNGMESLEILKDAQLTPKEVVNLFKYLDKDSDGKVSISDFTQSFQVVNVEEFSVDEPKIREKKHRRNKHHHRHHNKSSSAVTPTSLT